MQSIKDIMREMGLLKHHERGAPLGDLPEKKQISQHLIFTYMQKKDLPPMTQADKTADKIILGSRDLFENHRILISEVSFLDKSRGVEIFFKFPNREYQSFNLAKANFDDLVQACSYLATKEDSSKELNLSAEALAKILYENIYYLENGFEYAPEGSQKSFLHGAKALLKKNILQFKKPELKQETSLTQEQILQQIYDSWGVSPDGAIKEGGRIDIILKAHKEKIEQDLREEFQPYNDEISFDVTRIDEIPDSLCMAFTEAQEKHLREVQRCLVSISFESFKSGMKALVKKQRELQHKQNLEKCIISSVEGAVRQFSELKIVDNDLIADFAKKLISIGVSAEKEPQNA